MITKKWFASKTIWLSILTVAAGALGAFISSNSGYAHIAEVAIILGAINAYLRLNTNTVIE